mmetsp:Transcript_51902/g.118319  ORF Transcript_51902/g.118319 Transcript_51902/m.118319 type:complete len:137 (+) Transcript_51902:289-699(+)
MDALSSLVVMIIGFIARYAGRPGQLDFTDYLDAITSVVMALMTALAVAPVLRGAAHVLLEGHPRHLVTKARLERALLRVEGARSVDRLWVLQLDGRACVAAVQGSCDVGRHAQVLSEFKRILKVHGIEQSTVELYF